MARAPQTRGSPVPPLRVILADDAVLIRESLARLLGQEGFEVVGQVGNADDLMARAHVEQPDIAIIDIRMPPTHTDEGLTAARRIRQDHPEVAVLVLSQYVDLVYAMKLVAEKPRESATSSRTESVISRNSSRHCVGSRMAAQSSNQP